MAFLKTVGVKHSGSDLHKDSQSYNLKCKELPPMKELITALSPWKPKKVISKTVGDKQKRYVLTVTDPRSDTELRVSVNEPFQAIYISEKG